MKTFTVKDLKAAIADWPEDDPVVLRINELDEVQLTCDMTGVDQYDDCSLLLIGELPRENTKKRGRT